MAYQRFDFLEDIILEVRLEAPFLASPEEAATSAN